MCDNSTSQSPLDKARAAKEKALAQYGELDFVNGIGISWRDGEYSVKINLVEDHDDSIEFVDALDDVPVVVEVVGKIRKQGSEDD